MPMLIGTARVERRKPKQSLKQLQSLFTYFQICNSTGEAQIMMFENRDCAQFKYNHFRKHMYISHKSHYSSDSCDST